MSTQRHKPSEFQNLQPLSTDTAATEVLFATTLGPPPEGGFGMDPGLLVIDRLPHWGYEAGKRALDVVLASALLVAFLPLLILIAVLTRLTGGSGPVFFRQNRVGREGQVFRMLKFRTMVANAAELEERLKHLSIVPWPDFKIPNDPRVTLLGRFLRVTSLDELPNLFNVLTGEMSLVGPRPIVYHEKYVHSWPKARLTVLPGVTGLWQVSGRCTTGQRERIRLDLDYVERRSLLLDLKILFRTIGAVFSRVGAY